MHASINVGLTVGNVTTIESGITIHLGVSTKIRKTIVCAKKIIAGTLLHALVKTAKYSGSIIDDIGITCDEILNAADRV